MSVPLSQASTVEQKRQRLAKLLEERVARPQRYPLSFTQQRLWFLDQLDPGGTAYLITKALHLRGSLSPATFEASLREIVRRHKVLRTRFTVHEGEPVQVVDRQVELVLPTADLSGLPDGPRHSELQRLVQGNLRTPFDLRRGHLFRGILLRLGDREHVVLLATHHIVADGWSIAVIVKELAALYMAFCAGLPSPLPRLPLQYAEYAEWQRRWLTGDVLEAQLGYWKERLSGAAPLELPIDHPRPPTQTFRGADVPATVSPELLEALAGLARRQGATLFMTALAVLQTLLSRVSGEEDVSVGSPIANRKRRELELLIGFFANTLVLRTDLSGDPTFEELLERVREVALGAFVHQDMPLEKLVQEIQPERDLARSPLFQVLFVGVQPATDAVLDLPGLTLETIEAERETAKFDLTLELAESSGGLQGALEYNADLFERSTAARLLGHFGRLLEAVVATPGQRIGDLPLLSEGERAQILIEWNATAEAPAVPDSLVQLFEEQTAKTPERTAIVSGGESLTYAELAARARQLARHLQSLGVGPDIPVGVYLDRSPELVVAVLGVLEAGGGYLPLDPAYPPERLAFMLKDSGVGVVLTRERLANSLPAGAFQVLRLDSERPALDAYAAGPLPHPAGLSGRLAYLIYTSGSTGRPKGVAMPHRVLASLMAYQIHRSRRWEEAPRTLQFSALSFDVSCQELFSTWGAGGTLFLISEELRRDIGALLDFIAEHRIERLFLPFVALRQLAETAEERGAQTPSLREVITAGEALQITGAVAGWLVRTNVRRLDNQYGPSETHVATTHALEGDPRSWPLLPPIGRLVASAQAYVCDRRGQPLPIGVAGELYLGGTCVARGYAGRPAVTAERFVPDPFGGTPGGRLYRTGDLARWQAGGVLEFLGRADHQVKIRGFRVELGEIETALAEHPGVRQAVIAVRDDLPGGRGLAAFVVSVDRDDEPVPTATELRQLLRKRLPDYMIPGHFAFLDRLPVTPSGKVDRRALSQLRVFPNSADREAEPAAGWSPAEELLAGIFAELLQAERVAPDQSFFDIGGHSLLATQVVSRLRQVFGVELPVRTVFEAPTAASLAAAVERALRAGEETRIPPLVRVARDGPLPLSFAQQRLWFVDQLQPGSAAYNIPVAVRLVGPLDPAALAATLSEIVRRHEALRTTFEQGPAGEPVQKIQPSTLVPLPIIDLRGLASPGAELMRLAWQEASRPFHLATGPVLRASLVWSEDREQVLLLTVHHIVSDGWSMGVLIRELGMLYSAAIRGEASPLPELPVQYADFAVWQRHWLSGEVLASELAHWRGHLAGAPKALELPTDRPRPAVQTFRGATLSHSFPAILRENLLGLARHRGATLFMVLLAGFQTLMARLAGETDISVGTPIAGRTHAQTEGLIGFFVNTLVMRSDLSDEPVFGLLLERVRATTLEAYAHDDLPFEKLVEELAPERDLGRTPLFQVMLALQNAPLEGLELPELRLEPLPVDSGTAKFELTLSLAENRGALEGFAEYNRDLFDATTILRQLNRLENLLRSALASPESNVFDLELMGAAERMQVVQEWSGAGSGGPRESCVHELFQERAKLHPEALAVSFQEKAWSYGELDHLSDSVAERLRNLGIGPEVPVGLFTERSLEMLAGVLGILKTGGVYVPLDPSSPAERLDWMLRDTGAQVVLAQERLLRGLPERPWRVLALEEVCYGPMGTSAPAPNVDSSPDNLAYILYTSGSTGKPKGVAVPHRAVVRLVRGWGDLCIGCDEVWLQLAPLAFDASTLEIWGALANGGRLAVFDPHKPTIEEIGQKVESAGVTSLWLTAGLFHQVAESDLRPLRGLRKLLAGGDVLSPAHVRRALEELPGCRVINGYGPTENTTFTCCHALTAPSQLGGSVPIGRPIAHTRVYVVDRRNHPVPPGVAGELLTGGDGLARGYHGRPDLTADLFVPDPFAEQPGERLYRTGDLARWRPGGEIEFLGRIDQQVKIRGVRIELGEIEMALGRHAGLRDVAVTVWEDRPGERRLVAYVVGSGEPCPGAAELRSFLAKRLPEQMVPAAFVALDTLPLTPNGKVDRRALPPPDWSAAVSSMAPRTVHEEVLAEIFADILGLKSVGVEDDFFALGGHSLMATRLVSRTREAFDCELPLRLIFELSTVAALAARIASLHAGPPAPPILPVPRTSQLPLSFAQQRLWFLDRLAPDNPFYNIFGAVQLTGALDIEAIRWGLQEIVRRHEALRTTFRMVDGHPIQAIAPRLGFEVPLIDLQGLSEQALKKRSRAELARLSAEESLRPFDLAQGPLFRAHLVRLGFQEHTLLVNLHHVISDGWSMGILFGELATLYGAFSDGSPSPLPELPIQYADFAVWQRQWLQGERLEADLDYWRRQLAGIPEALELPFDHPRPAIESFRGGVQPFVLPETLVRELTALARRQGATLSMTMLAGFSSLLARSSRQEDIPFGLAIANRTRHEVENLIGFFVNTLVLRSSFEDLPGFGRLVARVRETALEAYAHQDLPFERLVEELQPERNLSRNPLIQVMVGYQNFPWADTQVRGLVLSPSGEGQVPGRTAKLDLSLFLVEEGGQLMGSFEYNSDLFEPTTLRRLVDHFENLLAAAVAQPDTPIALLPLMTEGERHQVALEWNDTGSAYPSDANLTELFAARVRATPGAPALRWGQRGQVSYSDLSRRADSLACRLRRLGIGPESRVGLCLERSPKMVVGLLGILAAGGAYVPLDPAYPRERLDQLMRHSGVSALVTEERWVAALPAVSVPVLCLDGHESWEPEASSLPGNGVPASSLAYVMYTSGSTGEPKGVAVTHRGVVRLVRETGYARFGADEVFLQIAPFTFDASTPEIWGPLLNGGCLVIVPPGRLSLAELGELLSRSGVTTLHLTTGLFNQMVDENLASLAGVRQLLTGGDVMSVSHARRASAELPGVRLLNMYGPTENTTFTCCHPVEAPERVETSMPIGRAIANTTVHLLDPHGRPVPIGVVGELWTGGDGLARGYLGRPELTAERFLPDPFAGEAGREPGSRLYRTGDLARRLADGSIEFLGRMDHQVKVRGFRIEPAEVESRLGEHPAVLQNVVLAREDVPGDRRLVAYVVQNPAYEALESGAQDEQVSHWSELFDDTYGQDTAEGDPTFNIIGWNSSYTDLPLPRAEMEDWLEDAVERITALGPRRVLEIGCGTGLILFRIAPRCELYVGTDISGQGLDYIDCQLARADRLGIDRSRVRLLRRSAEQLDGLEPGTFDTVILNSVVQYFPSAAYLSEVVERALELLRPGGAVFLGDLRSLPLLEAFHTSLELFQAAPETPLPRLRQKVQTRRLQENELVVSPAFFANLARRLPRISRVEVHPKHGRAHNELTGFRYQVVLRAGEPIVEPETVPWLDWRSEELTLESLRRRLEQGRPGMLGLRNVPNARVSEAAEAARLLRWAGGGAEEGIETAGDLRRRAAEAAAGAVEPQDFWDLGAELSYEVELGWASPGAEGGFDAVLRRRDGEDGRPALSALLPAPQAPEGPSGQLTNNPLQGRFARRIAPELRAFLGERLPEYMVPSSFVLLDSLPLTPNEKVDRRRLPAPDFVGLDAGRSFVAPRNRTEETLLEIWRELLRGERIGVEDDFFALGGHSLLATQAVSRVRKELGVELPLRTFFEAPTVAAVAAEVEALLRSGAETGAPSIVPVRRNGPLPLSFAQERLWFLHLLDRRVLAYNESSAFRLHGRLDESAFRWSLDEVVRRHESLRTVFPEVEGWAAQRILPPAPLDLPAIDLRGLPTSAREEEAARLAREQARHPFDLVRGPLARGLLVRLDETEHAVVFFFHHIVFDGWSTAIFVRELSTLYAARVAGEPSPLPPLPIQYSDFAVWQRQWLQGEALERQLGYWRERLAGVAVLDLPTDRPRRARPAAAGDWHPVAVAPGLTQGLREISRRQGATLFMTVLAAFQALLHRLAGQDDVAVGTPIANRNRAELEDLIGFFVNMLVLRTDLSGSPAFAELVGRARKAALGAYAHQDLPFEKLVAELQPDRDLLHNPLFQVGFQLLNLPPTQLEMPGLSLAPFPFATRFAKFDLNMVLTEEEEWISGLIDYDSELFEEPTVIRFLHCFEAVLAAVAADPAVVLSEIPLLSPWERHQLLVEWGGTGREPAAGTLHGRFAEEARRRPEAPAVRCAGATLSYGELARRASQLARLLRGLGVGPESRVALCLERSPDLVVGILGILESGGAYVPLDPAYPRERLAYMVEDSGARVVVGSSQTAGALPDLPHAILLDAHREELDALPAGGLEPLADGAGLAYVIYTSGSTGNPKGALVTHGNAVRLFDATAEWFGFGERDVWTLFHSYAFDFSVWEIWGALLYGGRLVVVPYEVSRSPEMFLDLLAGEGVTVLNQTPSAFAELAKVDEERGGAAAELRLVIFGGEALDLAGLAPWFERHGDERPQLVNMYGITETTVHVTYRPLRAADARGSRRSAIGVPIPDLSLHVLDPWMRPAPIGVPGELAVGGAGLARGYLNRPELTAERFVPDPFGGRPGARLYRSGDLARYLADGDLEYLGRIDHQVKIRGFRIELGEIQAALEEHPAVRQAVVLPKEEQGGERRLVAFLVTRQGGELSTAELRAALGRRLPDYMVPAGFVTVEDLPLTRNGKVDRKALLAMTVLGRDEEVAYAPPRNPVEQALVEVWQEVLGLDRVGIDDRFFSLGGDSILSIRVCALARQRGISLLLDQLFEHQTVRELSETLGCDGVDESAPTEPFALLAEHDRLALPEGLEDAYPLAALQTGMLFHSGYTETSTLYQNVSSLRLEAPFDGESLRETLGQMLARHPVLRTSFDASRFSEPLQLVHRRVEPPLEVEDLRGLPPEDRDRRVAEAIEEERHRKFDETVPPLLRFRVHLLENGVFQFTWTEHHAILDGWSVAVLTAELFRLYRELRLGRPSPPPLPSRVTFRDFVALERRSLSSEDDRRFWLDKLEDAPRLRLPRRPEEQEGREPRMRSLAVPLDPGLAKRLQRLAGSLGVPLKHVLLAAHYRVLGAVTGQSDLVSGLVVNGRPETEDGDRVLGLFLNTVPLRLRLAGETGTWTELIRQTLEAEQELSPFRRYPMADLQRRLGGGELFETAFNYVHFHVLQGLAGDGELRVLAATVHAETNLPFNVSFILDGSWLGFEVEYDETRFDAAQVEAIAARYPRALERMAAHPAERYDAQLLLSEPERHQLLHEWNDTRTRRPDRPVHEQFDLRAAAAPEAVALIQGGISLTYGELRDQARRLADRLRSLGVGPEVRAGLLLDRSPDLIVGLLGILGAGGACLPLDPEHPETRLRHILEDSGAAVLATRSDLARSLPSPGIPTVLLDGDGGSGLDSAPRRGDLAYVIYTSGSTGTPKGVLVGHGPLANAIGFSVRRYGLKPGDRVLQFASISFDASLEEIFSALVSGATLVLRDDAMLESPRRLLEAAADLGITVLSLPTAYWHKVVAALAAGEARWPSCVRLVAIGGERAQSESLARWLALGLDRVELVNVYGPTEATIGCTHAALQDPAAAGAEEVPIGRPYANARVYLLDSGLHPVAPGAAGELHVGGDVLARGYLGQPALTAERFVPDPFGGIPGTRMYRTGDLAAHRADGSLEFRGRADAQVKIRGFRIEPGEIEAALGRHPGVREAVVVARERGGETVLAGYVVPGEPRPSAGELRRFLRGQVPAYMIPPALTLLDRLPLTVQGKVDTAALPVTEPAWMPEPESLVPRDALELQLVQLWEDLLGVRPVGVRDDFFELGGHSLVAVQLVARLRRSLGASLTLATLLRNPTIERLAAALRGGEPARGPLVELASGEGRPFFCVHAVGGEVFGYLHLARGLARPVYGLQVAEPWPPDTTLEEMAARHLTALREVQPAGPYSLGGWSMGGVLAFEMARQLERQGETVALLVLLDSFAPNGGRAPQPARDGAMVAHFAYDLARLFGTGQLDLPPGFGDLAAGEALARLAAEAERSGLLPSGLSRKDWEQRFEVFQDNLRAVERYTGGPCAAPALLLKATDHPEPDAGWGRLLARPIEVRGVPGDHYTLLQRPIVDQIAALLRARLASVS